MSELGWVGLFDFRIYFARNGCFRDHGTTNYFLC